jgi:hypothetical protein
MIHGLTNLKKGAYIWKQEMNIKIWYANLMRSVELRGKHG